MRARIVHGVLGGSRLRVGVDADGRKLFVTGRDVAAALEETRRRDLEPVVECGCAAALEANARPSKARSRR